MIIGMRCARSLGYSYISTQAHKDKKRISHEDFSAEHKNNSPVGSIRALAAGPLLSASEAPAGATTYTVKRRSVRKKSDQGGSRVTGMHASSGFYHLDMTVKKRATIAPATALG